MKLTDEMHNNVLKSPIGQYLNKLIEEAAAKGNPGPAVGGNVIQQLWAEFDREAPR